MQKPKGHVLYIHFISDGLKEFRSSLGSFKLGYNFRMSLTGKIAPLGFLARFCIMNHFKTLFYKTGLKTKDLNCFRFNDMSRNLATVGRMINRFTFHTHCLIFIRTIGQITPLLRRLVFRIPSFIIDGIRKQSIISTIKIFLFLITVRLIWLIRIFLHFLTLLTETIGIGVFQSLVKTLGFAFGSLTLAGFFIQTGQKLLLVSLQGCH